MVSTWATRASAVTDCTRWVARDPPAHANQKATDLVDALGIAEAVAEFDLATARIQYAILVLRYYALDNQGRSS